MYFSRKGKHKNIAYEQNLQVASFTGNLRNQCKNIFLQKQIKKEHLNIFLFSNYKSNKT